MIRIDPGFAWLADTAFNDYSQFGEDGVLQAIFSVIGAENEWCFECGAADGLFFSNTRRLIESGWSGILVEADPAAFGRLQANSAPFGDRVKCLNRTVGAPDRVDGILHQAGAPTDIDLVVIDVDGQDYYLLNSILQFRPRVVVVEYDVNADAEFIPVLRQAGQAGVVAISRLGVGKFYQPVLVNRSNVIFVRHRLWQQLHGDREKMLEKLAG